jgi:hypothetical protein
MVTTIDLYRELEAVTPDSLRDLLHDYFQVNTFWEIRLRGATATPGADGTFTVTLDLDARKEVLDSAGTSTEVPFDDLVEVGLFAQGGGSLPGAPVSLEKRRIRAGRQTLTLTAPVRPARAGVDPRVLLLDMNPDNNLADVGVK